MTLTCPTCAALGRSRTLVREDVSTVATTVFTRTCRGCHARWRIVVRPMGPVADLGFAHEARFAAVEKRA